MDIGALKKIVAANIAALRTANRMTQLELGEKLNYSDKAISRWERGDAVPDAGVLLQMSRLFGVTVDYLLHEHTRDSRSENLPPRHSNHKTIAMISFIGVWTVALLIFVVFYLLGRIEWLTFVYALPVSLILLLVLNSLWGKRRRNLYIISLLIWSILGAVYLSLLEKNWWILFLLGIPAQIITCLCFRIHPKRQK